MQRHGHRGGAGVQRNAHVTDHGAARSEYVSGTEYPVPDTILRRRREALGKNPDPQAFEAGREAGRELRRRPARILAAVVSVRVGHDLRDPGDIGDAERHHAHEHGGTHAEGTGMRG